MRRLRHGEVLTLGTASPLLASLRSAQKIRPFGYMFPDLQHDDANLLEDSATTIANLGRLGAAMSDPGEVIPGVTVEAIHTFFGQFVDHDITLELGSASVHLNDPRVLTLEEVTDQILNSRTPDLDLDSVYGPDINGVMAVRDPDPINGDKMLLGEVAAGDGLPPGKDVWNDLPRDQSGAPQVGDSRNDENIVLNQLHVAFLRAHNAIVDRGYRFDEARKLLTQHYQWIILNEFLKRICDPKSVKRIRCNGSKFFNPPPQSFFMPLEFSVAAYRFGHSKVRASYDDFNTKHPAAGLDLLFRFAGEPLPNDWVIDWPKFLDPDDPERLPRPIDTSLTEMLLMLDPLQLGGHDPNQGNLAIRNLLRGYILRLPTGQAVANAMAGQGIKPLTAEQINRVAKAIPGQADFLDEIEPESHFLTRTPLWFYILAEARFYNSGQYLGPVGSTIVAEVLIGVLRNSTYSILSDPQWRMPTLGPTPGEFDFEDLLKLAGVF